MRMFLAVFYVILIIFSVISCDDVGINHTHEWSEWILSPATCTETGGLKKFCLVDNCKETLIDGEETPILGHILSGWITIAQTCTDDGMEIRECTRVECNYIAEKRNEKAAFGHDWDKWTGTAATCTDGEETRICLHDSLHVENRTVPAKHNWFKWETIVPATQTTNGSEKRTCANCGDETRTLYATGNLADDYFERFWNNGIDTYPIQYTVSSDYKMEYRVIRGNVAPPNVVHIPAYRLYDDEYIPVTVIHYSFEVVDGSWRRQSPFGNNVNSVYIPDTFTAISSFAFVDCTSLTSVTIPSSVTSIGDNVFSGCSSLDSITIPNSVTTIGAAAFSGCSSLTSITIPSSVTSIGGYAFVDCTSLTSITIPSSVTTIGLAAFANCSSITNITIPSSVTSISDWMFEACTNLTSITIPSSVTSISLHAFLNCSGLTSITIPSSVTSIEYGAFIGCYNLISVTFEGMIPASNLDEGSLIQGGLFYVGPDNLRDEYLAGGIGTYRRDSGFWIKQ